MNDLLGTSPAVFVGVTVVLMGFGAYMTGQAVATRWKSPVQLAVYCLLLGLADRFLTWALFKGALLSWSGYVVDTAVLSAIAFAAYRFTLARRMTSQYPWLYERVGPFAWRAKPPGGEG